MASIKKLTPGQTVYEIKRMKMGNTTIKYNALYTLRIVEVDVEKETVIASWNGNPPRKFYASSIRKWKVNKPEPKEKIWGVDSY